MSEGMENHSSSPEPKLSNPTEASKGFLNKWTDRILGSRMASIATGLGGGLAMGALGSVALGNYETAIYLGIGSGVAAGATWVISKRNIDGGVSK